MKNRVTNLLIGLLAALLLWGVSLGIWSSTKWRAVEVISGGENGIIQLLTLIAFFFGLMECWRVWKILDWETYALARHLLPEKPDLVLAREDVFDLRHEMRRREEAGEQFFLVRLIHRAATQYRNEGSVSDVISVVTEYTAMEKSKSESDMEIIRYCLYVMSSLGFIGTVWGIADAMGAVDFTAIATQKDALAKVPTAMKLAFDTTLVALLSGAVLYLFYSLVLEKTDKGFDALKSYAMDNLVSRMLNEK